VQGSDINGCFPHPKPEAIFIISLFTSPLKLLLFYC
jgi:hypothetical protein